MLGTILGAGDFMNNKTAKILSIMLHVPVGQVVISQGNKSKGHKLLLLL